MKNIIITILVMLVLGLGGYLVYDKVDVADNNIQNIEQNQNDTSNSQTQNNTNETSKYINISKYVGTYVGEKGTDSIIIKEDGTYEFVLAGTSEGFTETKVSKGLVISNGIYIALVEFYDTYPTDIDIAPLLNSYHFYINDSKLEFFGQKGTTDSIYFQKNN